MIFGGEIANHVLSNELWLFNTSTFTWVFLGRNDIISGLAGHSLTPVGSKLYLFGGKKYCY